MPRMDGTGPMGTGKMMGRGIGLCNNGEAFVGRGVNCRSGRRHCSGQGLGRGLALNRSSNKTQKDLLQDEKNLLQNRINVIDKQLKDL